jgi:hypothetical protein
MVIALADVEARRPRTAGNHPGRRDARCATTVRFHTEHLISEDERRLLRQRWREALLDRIEAQLP